ncbi:tRNA-dihydrouridine synthase [Clostridium sp. CAG:307]|nr:MAG: tRNA dihydrouridine synthase DusB [Clostridium sp. CAG:307_30_263]CDE26911.1 tRNA-dihydrouridine synthase [Clostridium sp. CAG:307]
MKWKIGNVEIENQLVLAPMAGITNEAFRSICKEMGAGLVVCEMISDKALSFHNAKTIKMTGVSQNEHPLSMQIFGADKETLVYAAKWIYENTDADIIDINMGCPVNKVAKRAGAGSSLLRDPNKVYEITKAVVEATPLPVTVKIRIGWDENNINAVENAKMIEKAGACAIAVHGRTRAQMYSGHANLDVIKDVVEAVNIPVVGNGDIVDGPSALHMLEYTGCKAIMIGRGALGNPWIFKEINAYFAGEEFKRPSKEEIYNMIVDQYERLLKLKGERLALLEMRSHVGWYLKGMQGSAQIKNKANQALSFEEVKKILKEYLLA